MERTPGSPLELEPAHAPVVRLNRRVLYVLGAALAAVFVVGLVALRAQGPRAASDSGPVSLPGAPAGERWFDKVPDQEPSPAAAPGPLPPPGSPGSQPAGLEAQHQERALRAALGAPIGVSAFATRAPRPAGEPVAALPRPGATGAAIPAPALAAQGATGQAPGQPKAAGPSPEVLQASVRGSVSPYEVKAGTIIPGVMLTGINSDLPGQITAQVREQVFDTVTGQHLLIPQGTRLVGLYDHQVVYAQERVLISWKRLIFPNGASLSLREGMPGTDALGAAGFADQVNHHYLRIFGNALLLSVITAGVQLSQIPQFGRDFEGPTAGNVLGAAVGQQLGSTAAELIRRGINIAPTLEIRPGYPFNIMVTQDMVFPGPYDETRQP
jgi:type IV secretory pathway VirB10-like protein